MFCAGCAAVWHGMECSHLMPVVLETANEPKGLGGSMFP